MNGAQAFDISCCCQELARRGLVEGAWVQWAKKSVLSARLVLVVVREQTPAALLVSMVV